MNLIDRLKELESKIDELHDDEIRCSAGWPEYIAEVEKALPKLLAVVEAASLLSQAFAGSWAQERSDLDRLRKALAALDQ